MIDLPISSTNLRAMLGARLQYRGAPYTVIEIIDTPTALILEADEPSSRIQTDVNGNARREMRELVTVPIFTADSEKLHSEFLQINLL